MKFEMIVVVWGEAFVDTSLPDHPANSLDKRIVWRVVFASIRIFVDR